MTNTTQILARDFDGLLLRLPGGWYWAEQGGGIRAERRANDLHLCERFWAIATRWVDGQEFVEVPTEVAHEFPCLVWVVRAFERGACPKVVLPDTLIPLVKRRAFLVPIELWRDVSMASILGASFQPADAEDVAETALEHGWDPHVGIAADPVVLAARDRLAEARR